MMMAMLTGLLSSKITWRLIGLAGLIGLVVLGANHFRGNVLTKERTTVELRDTKAQNTEIQRQSEDIAGVVDHQTNITTRTIETQRTIERNIANGKQDSTAISPVVADTLRQLRELDQQERGGSTTSSSQ